MKYLRYSVILLPALFLWAGLNMHLAKFANDPQYVYLLNSAAMCDGKNVGYIDHPGTTVMQIGAATIFLKHSFSNPGKKPVAEHVLTSPHRFVVSIRNVLLFLNVIGLFFLGWMAVKKTGSVWIALLLQAFTFISANTLDHAWTKISPEPLLFFITCIYIIAILCFYTDKEKNSWKWVIAFALITGAGLATKATFLPLVVFPLFIIPEVKKKMVYLASLIPAFVLFTIPIIPEYKHMYYWFRDLISHSGIYGHGDKGVIDVGTYFPNILKIMLNNPIFAIVFITGAGVVAYLLVQNYKTKKPVTLEIKILTGLVASSAAGILMVAKHYHSNHYLIPALLLTGVSFYFVLKILLEKIRITHLQKFIWPSLFLVLVMFLAWKLPPEMKYINEGYRLTNEELDATQAMVEADYPDYTKIYYYPVSLNKFSALNFGDVYTQRRMLDKIKELYPEVYFYNSIEKSIQNWNAQTHVDDLIYKHGNRIMLIGGPRGEAEAADISEKGFPLKNIYKGRLQAIYLLDTLRYNRQVEQKELSTNVLAECDAEAVTADRQYFLGPNGEKFGNAGARTQEMARSGSYSVKMDKSVEFALDYQLTNLKEGAEYEVEIWRNAKNNSGRLVVSSADAQLFYKAQADYTRTDENGWQLLRINFTVTPEMEGETLKVYLWNKDKLVGYFDDLVIRKLSNSLTEAATK